MSCFHNAWVIDGDKAICSGCGEDVTTIPGIGWDEWFFDGRLKTALEAMKGREIQCILEKGVLLKEDARDEDMRRLIEGDVVYRLWGGEEKLDPREKNFRWSLLDHEGNEV